MIAQDNNVWLRLTCIFKVRYMESAKGETMRGGHAGHSEGKSKDRSEST